MYKVETERLYFRPFVDADAENLFALDSNPRVHEYLGKSPLKELAEAVEIVKMIQEGYKKWGIGRYATFLKQDDAFIGWVGLNIAHKPVYGKEAYYDLGYRLMEAYWGQGYATEAAKAWLEFGLKEFPEYPISAYVEAGHEASKRVLEKVGMHKIGELIEDGDLCDFYTYPK